MLGIHQRQCQRREIQFFGRLEQHHCIIARDGPGAVGGEDSPNTLHPENLELGGAQGADARRAKDAHALREQLQYFLVPDCRGDAEAAVDQPHRGGRIVEQPREIAADRRRPQFDATG